MIVVVVDAESQKQPQETRQAAGLEQLTSVEVARKRPFNTARSNRSAAFRTSVSRSVSMPKSALRNYKKIEFAAGRIRTCAPRGNLFQESILGWWSAVFQWCVRSFYERIFSKRNHNHGNRMYHHRESVVVPPGDHRLVAEHTCARWLVTTQGNFPY